MSRIIRISIVVGCLISVTGLCFASPTGLNNIPTTDVVPDKTLVLQTWLTSGEDAKPVYVAGFKYGIIDRVEVGLDSKIGSVTGGPVALQGKLKIFESDIGFASLAGVEGITFESNRRIEDDILPYFALSQDIRINEDLQLIRLHGGYIFQKNNFGFFFGADRTFDVLEQTLILRSDIKQVNDMDDLLISGGFLFTLPFNLVLESWLNIPTQSGKEESVTVKLNYVIKI